MSTPFDPQLDPLKVPPRPIEAEQSVLDGLLLDNVARGRVVNLINEHNFYRHDHRLIFHNIGKLTSQAKPADVITAFEQLRAADRAEKVGGLAYLNALAQNTPSAVNIRRYAKIVCDRDVLRQLVTIADGISAGTFNPQGRDMRRLLDEAGSKVFAIAKEGLRGQRGFLEVQPLLMQVVEHTDGLYYRDNQSGITGVPTSFVNLDRMANGMQGGDLIIVAGRPSMGRTMFSLSIDEHVAVERGLSVVVFSAETAGAQFAIRVLGSVSQLDQHRLRTSRLLDEDWPCPTHAVQRMNDAQFFIDETPMLNSMELHACSRRFARQCEQLGLTVIGYLQLISGSDSGENRTTEISEISRSFKGLAKELNCPVIMLSQLNRSLEQYPNKRPAMSDLRESDAIEQDADVVLFIYRGQIYNPDSPGKGMAKIITGKQRNGPISTVHPTFLGEYTKFDNFTGGNASFDNDT